MKKLIITNNTVSNIKTPEETKKILISKNFALNIKSDLLNSNPELLKNLKINNIKILKPKRKCRRKSCNNFHNHNGGYCSAECFKLDKNDEIN